LQRETSLILEQPVLPGVLDYLEGARRLGLRVGLASSSSCEWVLGHLSRLGLLNYFHEIRASEDVKRTKPDPALYLQVLHGLGVPAEQGVALEDSPNGILAAKRAGLFCVAVPNALTRRLPLDHADLRLESLADLPLESLLVEVEGRLHGNG
jgi:HAD superfamily hydrolase (TIGR01509 family)